MFRILRLAALGAALCLILSGCQTQLYADLQEKEANAMLAALLDAGLLAEKRPGAEGTYMVFVEESHFAPAVKVLDSLALPSRRYDGLGVVFGKDALFSTPAEERARYLHAMQEELSRTVSAIDGVLEARVHLVLPERDQMGRELGSPSAAVMARHVDDERHDPALHGLEIRRLVAASVPNLPDDRIVVTFFPVRPVREYAAAPVFASVLGVVVAEDSASRLWWTLGAAAGLCLILAGLAVFAFLRKGGK